MRIERREHFVVALIAIAALVLGGFLDSRFRVYAQLSPILQKAWIGGTVGLIIATIAELGRAFEMRMTGQGKIDDEETTNRLRQIIADPQSTAATRAKAHRLLEKVSRRKK